MTTNHVRGCTGKRKFSSEAMAVEVGTAKHRKFKKESVLHPYLCKHCGCWHTSHETQEEHDREQARILADQQRVGAIVRAKVNLQATVAAQRNALEAIREARDKYQHLADERLVKIGMLERQRDAWKRDAFHWMEEAGVAKAADPVLPQDWPIEAIREGNELRRERDEWKQKAVANAGQCAKLVEEAARFERSRDRILVDLSNARGDRDKIRADAEAKVAALESGLETERRFLVEAGQKIAGLEAALKAARESSNPRDQVDTRKLRRIREYLEKDTWLDEAEPDATTRVKVQG